jgi:DNA-binding NarL/FixJ family response regulator
MSQSHSVAFAEGALVPYRALHVLLLDDHALLRAGVRALLERQLPGIQVIETDSVDAALRLAGGQHFDLAIVDITLRQDDGLRFVRALPQLADTESPHCLVLSMHQGEGYVQRAFEAGAMGYVVKDAIPEELLLAVHSALSGQRYLSPSVGATRFAPVPSAPPAPHLALTERQLQVLKLVAMGLPTKLVAQRLNLSVRTVDAHRYQISQRLGLHDVASWVHYALHHGLIEGPP